MSGLSPSGSTADVAETALRRRTDLDDLGGPLGTEARADLGAHGHAVVFEERFRAIDRSLARLKRAMNRFDRVWVTDIYELAYIVMYVASSTRTCRRRRMRQGCGSSSPTGSSD